MAAYDFFTAATGTTQYVALLDPVTGGIWNTAGTPAYEAFNAANITDYDIAGTELTGTGIFRYQIPATLPAGFHNVVSRTRAGGAPVVGDSNGSAGYIFWDGSVIIPVPSKAQIADAILARNAAGGSDGGKTVAYYMQGGLPKVVQSADGLTVDIYAADGVTVLANGVAFTRLSTAIGGPRNITPP